MFKEMIFQLFFYQMDLLGCQHPRMKSSALSSGKHLLNFTNSQVLLNLGWNKSAYIQAGSELLGLSKTIPCYFQAFARVQVLVLGDQGHGDLHHHNHN